MQYKPKKGKLRVDQSSKHCEISRGRKEANNQKETYEKKDKTTAAFFLHMFWCEAKKEEVKERKKGKGERGRGRE